MRSPNRRPAGTNCSVGSRREACPVVLEDEDLTARAGTAHCDGPAVDVDVVVRALVHTDGQVLPEAPGGRGRARQRDLDRADRHRVTGARAVEAGSDDHVAVERRPRLPTASAASQSSPEVTFSADSNPLSISRQTCTAPGLLPVASSSPGRSADDANETGRRRRRIDGVSERIAGARGRGGAGRRLQRCRRVHPPSPSAVM